MASASCNGQQWPNVEAWAPPRGDNVFEVVNDSEMDHPFHLHGFFFQILSRDGVVEPSARRVWKDTTNVRARSRLVAAVRFDEPGSWLSHLGARGGRHDGRGPGAVIEMKMFSTRHCCMAGGRVT